MCNYPILKFININVNIWNEREKVETLVGVDF